MSPTAHQSTAIRQKGKPWGGKRVQVCLKLVHESREGSAPQHRRVTHAAQAQEWKLGKLNLQIFGFHLNPPSIRAPVGEHVGRPRRREVEVGSFQLRRMDEDVREAVLAPAVEHHGRRKEVAHRLAPSRNRGMDGGKAVARLILDEVDDLISTGLIVFGRANVIQRIAVGIVQQPDAVSVESKSSRFRVLGAELGPPFSTTEQSVADGVSALAGGQNVDARFGWVLIEQRVCSFRDDLRRGAGNEDERSFRHAVPLPEDDRQRQGIRSCVPMTLSLVRGRAGS